MVNKSFSCCTPGVGVNVIFSESMSTQQREWLSSTTVLIDSITFSNEELASEFLAQVHLALADLANRR